MRSLVAPSSAPLGDPKKARVAGDVKTACTASGCEQVFVRKKTKVQQLCEEHLKEYNRLGQQKRRAFRDLKSCTQDTEKKQALEEKVRVAEEQLKQVHVLRGGLFFLLFCACCPHAYISVHISRALVHTYSCGRRIWPP